MNIERVARTLLGTAALCGLLVSVGCNSMPSSNNSGGPAPSGTPIASVKAPGDWGMSLLAGGTVGIGMFPAKFTFDVTATPSCSSDYVAFNTSLVASTLSIVAFDNLYATQGGTGGSCGDNGPSVKWAYRVSTTGTPVTSTVLSLDGSQVAFVESNTNVNGGSILHLLKWKPGFGTSIQGTLLAPATPDTTMSAGQAWNTTNCPAANSCIVNITFNGAQPDTKSAPFYDYVHDVIYVGDDNGRVHKFVGVFLGTPAEVVTAPWPITVNAGAILTSPIYDSVSKNIFVGDSTGRLSSIREVGSTVGGACTPLPCLSPTNLPVGTAGAIVAAPVVDGSTGMVFAVNGTETSSNGRIVQANTALVSQASFAIGGTTAPGQAIYSGAFDNAYLTSALGAITGHMYVCGKDSGHGDRPYVYQMSFGSTGILTGVGTGTFPAGSGWTSGDGEACSQVTEFFNPNGGGSGVPKNWIFFSIGNLANNAVTNNPIPAGGCRTNNAGCVISVDVTTGPTWPLTLPTTLTVAAPLPALNAGSASGIVVDNTSTFPQTSSFYFTLGTNSVGAGPGVPSCNTTAGVGCAIKLTQSALN